MAYALAVRPSSGRRTWTVIDCSHRTVAPIEGWLEAHRTVWSPNTVRGYATALAHWWSFLELGGEADRWDGAEVSTVLGFVSWLRNGRTVEHSLVTADTEPSPRTLEARSAALSRSIGGRKLSPRCRWPVGCCVVHHGASPRGDCWRTCWRGWLRDRRRWCG